jgi:flagellar assembly protein FliH
MSSSPEPILRGSQAQSVTAARWQVDLRKPTESTIPTEVVERVTADARAAGYAEGWAQGQRDARAAAEAEQAKVRAAQQAYEQERADAVTRALGALTNAVAGVEARTVPVLAGLTDEVLRGAVELAEALLGRELSDAPERGLDALRRVMSVAPESGTVTVRLHPDDLAALGEVPAFPGRDVRLVPDPSLRPGDALADQGTTTIDARLSEAVRRVRDALR